jgi:hypothetical protein
VGLNVPIGTPPEQVLATGVPSWGWSDIADASMMFGTSMQVVELTSTFPVVASQFIPS